MSPVVFRLNGVKFHFFANLVDGRTLGVPLAWFPILFHATPEQRLNYRIGADGEGLRWDEIDEDISVEGLLLGYGDMTNRGKRMKAAHAAE